MNIAVVAVIFSVVTGGLLFVNYWQTKVLDPLQTERLEAMKMKLSDQPNDPQLVEAIRRKDRQLREGKMYRLYFSRRASVLLLVGVLVCLAAWKTADSLSPPQPHPEPQGDAQSAQVHHANAARWSITVAFVLFCGLSLYVAAHPKIELEEPVAPYPSMEEVSANWASFRGPEGAGVSAYANVPSRWNEERGEGILWKSPVALPGHSSPVVWEDRIFLSGATEEKQEVYCWDLHTGELLWTGEVPRTAGEVDVMEDTGYAAPTMVTDGRRAYVLFATCDMAAFDFDGRRVWTKSLGVPESAYGYACSLAMYQNLVFVQYDQGYGDAPCRMIAMDGFSGNTVWEVNRPVASSWTSPIVADTPGGYQLITCGKPFAIGYNPANGTELWRVECLGEDLGASPIYANGLAMAVSPYEHIVAIQTDGSGDVTETHIKWTSMEGLPDICSPVSDGTLLYTLMTQGTLTCYELVSGEVLWEKDLETVFQASPSLVGDTLYLMSEKGETILVKSAREFIEVGRCRLAEGGVASPAFVDGRIIVRTKGHLYCLGDEN